MKARFTGHDTFPLRYGWLFKAINHLNSNGKFSSTDEESIRHSIVELGVGKNMVKAIQYWAESSNIIEADRVEGTFVHTASENGSYLFGDGSGDCGQDPYLELPGSIWLLHFWLNFNSDQLTAYRYFFNYSNVQHFEKSKLVDDCFEDAKRLVRTELGNISTIKKDIDCFLNSYSKKVKASTVKKATKVDEDHFTSPLAELNLIQDNGGGFYISNLNERSELPVEIFIFALLEFFKVETKESNVSTIDFDSLLTKPCSPGRIFRLSESGLGQKLDEVQELTNKEISWVDSLGLRQVNISTEAKDNAITYLNIYYGKYNV
ncbi:DUF4007 family protein [Rheinheimera sp. D18]|uniref:DUF4007 family protein n=1 Tax=Rheinheimera sp. D18 TaxID=2545632 RepID=UPI00104FE6BE|nr:DUF4007 family protein [Rheinheimera sp. D18]QBL10517.1 DUF4007 family protein [Rheinheimera sp. D18]